ncbi:lipopolysaccharide kinase InaA family protein [Gemmata sp.]|uniref:lipopolysaccharide kinase InaA family protein n=1 Tax=Gemmata sp. TaxID=1914242 RepID=UPI003F7007B4
MPRSVPRTATVFRPAAHQSGGWAEVNPAFAERFRALGIDSAAGFLELPGEVVSGHPDRHVVRVELPEFATAFYLKRQHAVTWRERLRTWAAGFGRVSRCEREAAVLKELQVSGLPGPQWVAVGGDGRGRAFLLVEEVAGATDLRAALGDSVLSPAGRRALAARVGWVIGRLHAAGWSTPDLTAKHLFVAPGGGLTLIDWQSARRLPSLPRAERLAALAALHASVADDLASTRDRLRVLRAALNARCVAPVARQIERLAAKARTRRSIRDQRQPVVTAAAQRLVWVAGEAVCAVPDVAAVWQRPAVAAPFYGCEPATLRTELRDGREGVLIRGRSVAPLGRFVAALRGRPWRSPGVTLGRVLFHLERYGVPAPRLFAFGQRLTGRATAEWFALHELPGDAVPGSVEPHTAEQLGRALRRLHDAGCRPVGEPLAAFGVTARGAAVRDVTRVRLVRKVSRQARGHDLAALAAAVPEWSRAAVEAGYLAGPRERIVARSPVRSLPVVAGS